MSFFAHFPMLNSSLAEAGVVPLLVFQWLCENAEIDGVVHDVRPRRIAAALSLVDRGLFTDEAVAAALEYLQRPDPNSKRRECEGRRIVPVETEGCAFRLVTWDYYQNEWSAERRKLKTAARQRRFKARHKASSNGGVTHGNAELTLDNAIQSDSSSSKKKERQHQERAPERTSGASRAARRTSPREAALRSVVETISVTRPAFAQGVNFKALSKLCTEFGTDGLLAGARSVADWSHVTDPLPYLRAICAKTLDRGANTPRARQDTGLG